VDKEKIRRPVRSYVLRQGRLTSGQAFALEHYWQRYGIDFSKKKLDLDIEFGRPSPKILDIGVGMGDTTITLARAHPENDYLAVEVHEPGIGSLLRQAQTADINNLRVIHNDVIETLKYQIPEQSLDQVYIFFPDPWPKKRHHKRRLINPEFLALLKPRLKSHARIYIATDWQNLAEHVLNICDNDSDLFNLAGRGFAAPRPVWRPLTKFEQRGKNLKHQVWDFIYALR
jgi:tRNA (guanine-N7-)-methyltransferase